MQELAIDSKDFDLYLKVAAESVRPAVVEVVTTSKEAEKYWGVLEFGSREGQRPWPEPRRKTRFGPNRRVFSKQAPQGFVFRHGLKFIQFLSDAYDKVFKSSGGAPSYSDLQLAVGEAGERTLSLIDKGVPVSTGTLRESLKLRKAK